MKNPKIELDAFEVAHTSLLLHTVVVAGLGDKKFLESLNKQIKFMQTEYKKQLNVDQQSRIAEKILKLYKVKP